MSVQRNNRVKITGIVKTGFEMSHDLRGERFYKTAVEVKRLSQETDIINIVISEDFINPDMDYVGQIVNVTGSFRSFNRPVEERTKLELFMFANSFEVAETEESGDTNNSIHLNGFVCKPPIFRKTPMGRLITDVMIAVNRNYGKSDYIPCVCWGENAKKAQFFEVGTEILLEGRVQSRTYKKRISDEEVEERVAYEVSVSRINRVGQEETEDEKADETDVKDEVVEVNEQKAATESAVVEE